MIKASKLFCLIFIACAVSGPVLRAQTGDPAVSDAADEAIHRQANTVTLRQTLVLAQNARQRGDMANAYKYYTRCYELVQSIGSGIEPEARATIDGYTAVLMDMAQQAQKHQDYKKAEEHLNRVLKVNPGYQPAQDLKFQNHKLLLAQQGHIPSQEQIERIPSFRTNEIRVATMIQDGKFLFEAGKIDEAEAKFTQAYSEDPSSVAAYQYLMSIRQKRMADADRKGDLESARGMIRVEQEWTKGQRGGELLVKTNQFARDKHAHTGPGREAIISKLDRIRMDSAKYDGLPLGEVINNLSEVARSRDPDKIGINFFIDRTAPVVGGGATGAIDPATGLPVAPLPTEAGDIGNDVHIKITPGLSDVRLADVLDAMTRTSDKPIRYSVLEYAVIFSLRGPEAQPLETRSFHVDPNTFRMGLESVSGLPFGNVSSSSGGGGGSSGGGGGSSGSGQSVSAVVPQVFVTPGGASAALSGGSGGGGGAAAGGGGQGQGGGLTYVTSTTNQTALLQVQARQFFQAVGVDLNTNDPANRGKSFVWNDRKGILLVRSTSADLDMIEAAVQALNVAPPEINIKAKFIEITQNDNRALGFQWWLGGTKLGGTVTSAGSQPSLNGAPSTVNPAGTFPGTTAATQLPAATTDGLLTGGLRNFYGQQLNSTVPTVGTVTGILTDPQFRVAINALEQRDGVDQLNAPEVTTESGRQAQIQAVDIQTIVTGVNVNATTSPTVSGVANGVNSPIVSPTPTANYPTSALPFGPVLDVIPYVSADEYSVQMTLIPTITEFIGYDDPGQFVPSALVSGQTGNASLQAVLPLPHFRMRQVTTSVSVWDAQTVVLGGLITDNVTKIKDKVPVIGDLPLFGRLFQSQSSSKSKKNLMIFVTPTIINPDGTRYHSDEEMPFNQNLGPIPKAPVTQ